MGYQQISITQTIKIGAENKIKANFCLIKYLYLRETKAG